jgi:ankyrin repeat protein
MNTGGQTALSLAIAFGRYSLVEWLLEQGGANINDTAVIQGEHGNVWDNLGVHLGLDAIVDETGLQSLLKVMHGASR